MKLVCIMPCRNEDWVIGLTARAVLMWCDKLIVLDHASTDRTSVILLELAADDGRVSILVDGDPTWNEMEHRQRLLDQAKVSGATHIALVDADEVLTANLLPTIRDIVNNAPFHATLQLPWQCLRGSIDRFHKLGVWGESYASVAFADDPRCHWSSRERGGYQFHHRHPMGRQLIPFKPVPRSKGGLMHLQFLDDRRLRAKQALYKMQEVVRWPNRMSAQQINAYYDLAVYGCAQRPTDGIADHGGTLGHVPPAWWAPYDGLMQYLTPDAPAWQQTECERLWSEYGKSKFVGLDLFGVVG